jgi:hypothetical protein
MNTMNYTVYSKPKSFKSGNMIIYPVNHIYKDETTESRLFNYNKWKQIQPEIQAIARGVIYNIELVKLALDEIRCKKYTNKYEVRITDAIFTLFNIGKDRFEEWLDQCDTDLNYEYSNRVFMYKTHSDNTKDVWIPFSVFMNHDNLRSYFNACILLIAMEFMTIDDITIKIIRSNFSTIPQFKTSLQEQFRIMDYYFSFQHQWKGSNYYNRIIFL